MRGVVMSVKGRYAVVLNKDGEFVKVRNKNYTVGSTVSVTSNTGRICALAASFLVVCGGIGSYFTPVGYVSVDINPSFLLTLNVYNKVIDIDALNDDAVILLENADVKGKNTEETVDILIKSSEEIGYINENNKDVIVEVVSGIRDVKIAEYADVEVVVEKAEKSDLRNAKEMGVSIAKAKAIKDYTTQNGGTVKDNAEKLAKKSVKEIRKGLETVADELPEITPAPTEKAKEVKVAKNSSKKKDKNPILSFIGGKKEEEKAEEKTTEEKVEVKPTLPATEIFRTPAPYFEPEKEQDKEEEVKEETREENKPSFPNQFIPQLQEKPTENEKEEEKPSATQRENENRGDSKENTTDKEVNAPVKDTDSSKAENQKTPDTGKQENNTSDRQENTVKTQQTDKNSGDNKLENNKPVHNESPKSENNRSESSNRNPGSGNESSNKTPSAPSRPESGNTRGEGGNDGGGESPSRGGADKGNGGGLGREK